MNDPWSVNDPIGGYAIDIMDLTGSVQGSVTEGSTLREVSSMSTISEGGLKGDIQIGRRAPGFSLTSTDGRQVRLSDFRGCKVMLCFYLFERRRNSSCYTVSKIIGNVKKLAWASNLKIVTIYPSDVEHLKNGLSGADAPQWISDDSYYPVVALADPDGRAASAFKLETNLFMKYGLSNPGNILTNSVARNGSASLIPSEFLIDEMGVLIDVRRATKSSEATALERVHNFLLHGTRHPMVVEKTNSKGKNNGRMRDRPGSTRSLNQVGDLDPSEHDASMTDLSLSPVDESPPAAVSGKAAKLLGLCDESHKDVGGGLADRRKKMAAARRRQRGVSKPAIPLRSGHGFSKSLGNLDEEELMENDTPVRSLSEKPKEAEDIHASAKSKDFVDGYDDFVRFLGDP